MKSSIQGKRDMSIWNQNHLPDPSGNVGKLSHH